MRSLSPGMEARFTASFGQVGDGEPGPVVVSPSAAPSRTATGKDTGRFTSGRNNLQFIRSQASR
jgi:hypothetical protein